MGRRVGAEPDGVGRRSRAAPRPPTPPWAVLLAAAVVAVLTVSASFAIATRQPTTTSVVGCYSSLDQEGSTVSVVVPNGRSATRACRRAWRSAFLRAAPARLTECVVEGGGIGVFPYPALERRGVCASIGAAIPDRPAG